MIRINGKPLDWTPGLTISALLRLQGYRLKTPPVHITVNGEKVGKAEWAGFPLPDGADIRIVSFLQGG